MATLDRKVPSPNTFLYKPWSAFIEAVKLQNSDIAHVEDTGKDIGNGRDARKLNREDMHLYGQYPAYDELCLVVCNICSQVVKPQGFLSHYERRHAPSCDSRPPLTQRPKVSHSSPPQPRPFRPPRDNQHTPFSRAPHTVYPPKGARTKPCVSVPVVSLEKMSCLGRVEGPHVRISYPSSSSSSSSSPAAKAHALPFLLIGQAVHGPAPLLDRKHQNGTKGTKPYKRVSGRVFDPNKHCGVLDPESKKPCTRSLTCKTHSLTHRRAVPGRGKQFDSLLAEHKGRHLREQQGSHAHPSRPAQSHEPTSSTSTDCQDGRTTSLLKSRLATAHIPRPPGGWSSVGPPDSAPPCPAAGGGDRLSGEEGEGETPEDLDCSNGSCALPQCCAFGSRLMGRGCFVFERRWDRVRVALRCMVEKHVNAQMWRKIPLAAESRTPYPGPSLPRTPWPRPARRPCPPSPALPALASPTNSVSMVTYSTAFPMTPRGTSTTPHPRPTPTSPAPRSAATGPPLSVPKPRPWPGLPRPLPFSGDHALFARADGRKRKSSSPVGRPGKTPKPAALSSLYRPRPRAPPRPPPTAKGTSLREGRVATWMQSCFWFSQRYLTEGGACGP
ncbi:hypothetical protein ANANG_G00314530 [Anguilla anguilla]|uniref:SCA7 domain-containing protein n=1 Tax=Anguilla anguilla TaxID=7936 RepID=A0A9D3LHI0_ANGAN|nr:hypothetical protein ANANG_G00314530 [Anguilla anguilla]